MRDKRIYTKTIAISETDLNFIRELKEKIGGKKTAAGVLSLIIDYYKSKRQKKLF